MTPLFVYLIEAFTLSVILYSGYLLFARNSSTTYKRIVLLLCLICSSIFPILEVPMPNSEIPTMLSASPQTLPPINNQSKSEEFKPISQYGESEPIVFLENNSAVTNGLDIALILSTIYFVVAGLFLIRMLSGLVSVLQLRLKATDRGDYYEVDKPGFKGASFFHWIFIGKQMEEGREMILEHEKSHVSQLHSLDKLLSELFCCLFWFNPLAYFIRKDIELNLEMDVDRRVTCIFQKSQYVSLLVNLSISNYPTCMLKFSAKSLKKRLNSIQADSKGKLSPSNLLFIIMIFGSFWLFSCVDTTEDVVRFSKNVIENTAVKSVSTTFISHQYDTKTKDDRIIAEAHFLPDGSLDYAKQHMTYPYNFEKPFRKNYWTTPSSDGLLHTLDGLSLSHAENNLLYGNDWPKFYAAMKEDTKPSDNYYREEVTTSYANGALPSEIAYNRYLLINENSTVNLREKFEYENEKVKRFYKEHPYTWDLSVAKDIEAKKTNKPSISDDYSFEYEGDQLKRLSYRNKILNFKYDEDARLISSTFEINGQTYNTRKYYYDERGLKTRTEIYNVDQQPEYTILYSYEFYSNK